MSRSAKRAVGAWTGRVLEGGLRPFCQVCNWRKGGPDSWDGRACKCGLTEPPMVDTQLADDIRDGMTASITERVSARK